MESDGSFEFTFHVSCPSDTFVANDTSIRIDTCAKIYHMSNPSDIYTDSTKAFKLTLYKKQLIGTPEIGSYIGYADNIYGGKTFTGLTVGATYYFIIEPVDSSFSQTGYYFTGYGNVTNVTVQ